MHIRSNLTDYTALRRLGSQHLAEWEGHLWDAVQYGRDSLTDLPPRAQRVSPADRLVALYLFWLCVESAKHARRVGRLE